MSKLFNVAGNNITYHLQNIFKTKKLKENLTTQKIRVVQNQKYLSDFDELIIQTY